jgi:hypothetical protein
MDDAPLFKFGPAAGPEAPQAEDMESAMRAARYSKTVRLKEFHVERYDLSDERDRERYRKDYVALYTGHQEQRAMVMSVERVTRADANPTVVVFMEWMEYDLDVKDHMKEALGNERGE